MSSDAPSEFRLVHVDAGQPLDAVLRRLKAPDLEGAVTMR